MEAVTEIKQGYKKTKIGWIPEDWNVKSISFVVNSVKSGVSVNSDDRIKKNKEKGILKTSSVSNGVFIPDENKAIVSDIELQRAKLNPIKDALLISRMNTPDLVGACAYIPETRTDLFIPDRLWLTSIDIQLSNSQWLNFLLNSQQFRFYIKNRATGTSNSMKNISKESFLGIKIPLPPLPEQQKIAQILSTWDKAIEQKQNLVEQLKKRKKGLMQQLLTGKTRLKGFSGEWNVSKLGKHLIKHSEITTENNQYPVLTSSRQGIFFQKDYYTREVASTDNTGYNVVPRGYFTYRHMSDDLIFKFNINTICDKGIVSTLYPVFTTKESINKDYLLYALNEGNEFKRYALMQKQGGSRTYMYYGKLSELKLNLPSLEEQDAIVQVLSTADKEIKTQETYLQQLQDQKKGLMQQLLTGLKRVRT